MERVNAMTAINDVLAKVSKGEVQHFENLEVTPLLAESASLADYLVLSEAQAEGLAVVTEVSESGSVPTLLLENKSAQAVFLLDGEELVGAKQNRILNLSVLVPAGSKLHIPVSCVEAGRWSHRSREFASADRAHFSRGRARKAAHVSANMRGGGVRESDQGEVWADIDMKMARMAVNSDTRAIADAYERFAAPLEDYVTAFQPCETQVGACFAINGAIVGIELFDASTTCAKLFPKLVRSYALDAMEEVQANCSATAGDIDAFLKAVAFAEVDSFMALGEGSDLRIRSPRIAGGALVLGEKIIHLCAFCHETAVDEEGQGGRMRRASARRRSRTHLARPWILDGDSAEYEV